MTDKNNIPLCTSWDELVARLNKNQQENAPLPPRPSPESAPKDREVLDEAAKERAARDDEFEEMYMEWIEQREREITGG